MSDVEMKYIELPQPPLGTENEAAEGKEDAVGKNGLWPETELNLNTSADLPEAAITTGMSPDSLSADVRAALSTGIVRSSDNFDPQPAPAGDGKADGCSVPYYVDPRGSPFDGFLGRATLLNER